MSALVCKFCGSDKGFREYGTVRVEASRTLRSAVRGPDGKLKPEWDFTDDEPAYDDDFEPDGVKCRECDREEARLEDLVGAPVMFEPGARVVCPDGLKGTVEHVDFDARRLRVEGWHEEFKFSEVTALGAA